MRAILIIFLVVLAVFLPACGIALPNTPVGPEPSVTLAVIFTPTPTPVPPTPTPTPEPLAARVNGEGILLREFEAELARYRQSGVTLAEQAGQTVEQVVLNTMLDERLLAQSAAIQGYNPGEADIQADLDELSAQVDLQSWMAAQGYDEASLKRSLGLAMQAAWMRDQLAGAVPVTAEQVHAVQILLYNSTDADEAYQLAQSGEDFLSLARDYRPTTGGEMGWFARGSLVYPSLEEAAFSLQAGAYSQIIQTELGYHILYIVERQADRPLDNEALRARQSSAILEWLSAQRSAAAIEIFVGQPAP